MNTREKAFGKFNQSRLKQVRARYLMSQEILSEIHLKYVSKALRDMFCVIWCKRPYVCSCLSLFCGSPGYAVEYCTYLSMVWKSRGTCNNMSTFECRRRRKAQACCWLSYFLFLYVLIEVGYCMGFPIKLLGSRLGQWRPFPFYFVIIWNFLMLLPPPVVCIYATSNRSWSEWGFSYARPSFSSGEVIH